MEHEDHRVESAGSKPRQEPRVDAPVKAVYLGYSDVSDIKATVTQALDVIGYNLIVLAFWLNPEVGVDPYSAAYYWSKLSDADKTSLTGLALSKNARIIVSAGGSTYNNY